jgi:hypothetical protein
MKQNHKPVGARLVIEFHPDAVAKIILILGARTAGSGCVTDRGFHN